MSVISASLKLRALSGASLIVLGALMLAQPARAQSDQPLQLGPVSVNDNADKNGQNHPTPITTMPTTSVQDTPQSMNVVTGEVMKQQAVTTLADALKNVPGITIAIGEGGTLAGDQFKINGFDAKDDVYLDGLRDFGAYNRDAFDYDEVQVLKGPSGTMFGRGTVGGAINTISRTPFLGDKYVGHIEGGNGGHVRGTADLNYQLSDTAAVRLDLMYTDTGVVDRDLTHSTRWGIAPSIALGLGTDTNFSLSWIHQQNADRPDYGIVVASPPNSVYAEPASQYGVPRSNYMGLAADHDKNTVDLVTAKISHVATPWLTLENDVSACDLYPRLPLFLGRLLRQHHRHQLLQSSPLRHRQSRCGGGFFQSHTDAGLDRRQRPLSPEQLGRAGHCLCQCRFSCRRLPQCHDRGHRCRLSACRPDGLCLQPSGRTQRHALSAERQFCEPQEHRLVALHSHAPAHPRLCADPADAHQPGQRHGDQRGHLDRR